MRALDGAVSASIQVMSHDEGNDSTQTDSQTQNRVKVYQLNQEGAWEDQGTGYTSLINKCILVHAEKDEKPSTTNLILEVQILGEDVYQRQGDTIISWNDPSLQVDLALSFQEAKQCTLFWAELQALQHSNPEAAGRASEQFAPAGGEYVPMEQQELPAPSMENLDDVANIIQNCGVYQREHLAQAFARKEYLRQLVELFIMCEDLENVAGLSALFRVFKGMVMLNDNGLLEILLSEDYILTVIGVLEYDPELNSRTPHREYLTKTVVFKEVVPIRDKAVITHTHQNFRVKYLKDVVLAKYLDDHTFSTLSTLIYFNSVDIVERLQGDDSFLDNLFSALLDPANTTARLSDLMGFLQEFCLLAKNLQLMARGQFYAKLLQRNLFGVIENSLAHTQRSLRLRGVDIASGLICQESHLCRAQMMKQSPKCGLLRQFVEQLFADNDAGVKGQLAELIRQLLDPELMEGTAEKDDFLNLFYEAFMEPLVSCISSEQMVLDKLTGFRSKDKSGQIAKEQMDSDQALIVATQNQVCEILAFCVQHHGYRIKYFILRHNIVQKALQLVLKKGNSNRVAGNFLTLTVMRFVRACVALKDEFYNRHLVKNNLFEPIMTAFQLNGNRYNLFNSVVIELVEFCRKENIKSLVAHLVEQHRDKFVSTDYVTTFTELIRKHEQNVHLDKPTENKESESKEQQQQPWRRKAESDDESYFNESDDEDDKPPALSTCDMDIDIGPKLPNGGFQSASAQPQPVLMNSGTAVPSLVGYQDEVRPKSPGLATFPPKHANSPSTQDTDGHINKKIKVDAR